MPSKPTVPKVPVSGPLGDKGLAVKDGLREMRFNMKRGARKLVQAVEAATNRTEAQARGPFGLLIEPLHLAMRTTANVLSNADHAVVDALSSDGLYRAMTVPLRSSASYFGATGALGDLRDFTTDHHWRYRHWLAMRQIGDMFVHEQAIAKAGTQVAEAIGAGVRGMHRHDELAAPTPRPVVVQVIQALMQQAVLSKPLVLVETDNDRLKELCELGAVVVVLAGEIAGLLPDVGARERYALALQLADEIAQANCRGWRGALHSTAPVEAMGRWIAFVLRCV